jgi:Carboxypeptidase regulatory-like domain
MSRTLRAAWLASALVWTAWCQGAGRLEGTVRDTSEAVVPGTLIVCVGEETGFRFRTESGPDGNYALTVPDGHYNMIVRRSGFRPIARMRVLVESSEGSRRVDFELKPSSVWETVTVSDVSKAGGSTESVATAIRPEDARALPRNDDSVTGLLALLPGILFTPASRGEPGQFSSLGARPNTNTFSVDGVSGNNAVAGAGWPSLLAGARLPAMTALGTTHDLAAFDAIQEVTVEPQGEAMGIEQAPGANIIIHTRSGTNQFHGSFSGGVRPAALGANDWFANRYGLSPDAPSLNEEGGSFGGPLRRGRTFLFVAAERLALRQGYGWVTTVPSKLARVLSPIGLLALLNEFPLPNGPAFNQTSPGIAEFIGETRLPAALTTVNVRLDHQFSQNARLFLRVADTPSWSESGLDEIDLTQYRNRVAVLGATVVQGQWTHDSRLSFSGNEATSTWSVAPGGEIPPPAFYSQYPSLAADFSNVVVGGAGSVSVGQDGRNLQNQWQISQVSAVQTPRHQLRFGLEYLELQPERNGPDSSVTVAFGTPTNLIYGPYAPVWVTDSHPEASSIRLRWLSSFAQDTWRINSRLSLGFGLRASWPQAPGIRPALNLYSVDDSNPAVVPIYSPILQTKPLWRGNGIQLAPSLSAAWRLSEKGDTVLRASWAVFHDLQSTAATDQLNGIPYQELQTPTGSPVQSYNPSDLVTVQVGYGFSRNLELPTYQRWNVQIEHDWSHRDSVQISYTGMSGEHELRHEIFLYQPLAPIDALIFETSNGRSQYNALNAAYRRTLAKGLQANVGYTWSHSIDIGSSDSAVFQVSPQILPSSNRGSSDFDVRHSLHAAITYTLEARRNGGIAGRLISQWTLGGIATARSAFPLDALISETLDGFAVANFRSALQPGVPLWITDSNYPGGRYLNPNAFVYPVYIPPMGRNVLRGFGMWQADLTAQRPIWEKDGFHLSIRADAYNAFNHAQFADPLRYASNPMFGQSQSALNLMFGSGSPSSGQSPAFLMGAPRSLQLSLRLAF